MNELGLASATAKAWFKTEPKDGYLFVRVTEAQASAWAGLLGTTVRRCYISDALLEYHAQRLGVDRAEIIASVLPEPGSIMSGDFGEVLAYVFQSVDALPLIALGPKKWQLKQDRTKPAPYSDVIQFIVPHWPFASHDDLVTCAEVKSKATDSDFNPIVSAIDGCKNDQISRLAKTLVWLKARAHTQDLGEVTIDLLNRFINAIDYPEATRRFRAVAVICESLVDGELANVPAEPSDDFGVVIISVAGLKDTYTAVFGAALHSSAPTRPQAGAGGNP